MVSLAAHLLCILCHSLSLHAEAVGLKDKGWPGVGLKVQMLSVQILVESEIILQVVMHSQHHQ